MLHGKRLTPGEESDGERGILLHPPREEREGGSVLYIIQDGKRDAVLHSFRRQGLRRGTVLFTPGEEREGTRGVLYFNPGKKRDQKRGVLCFTLERREMGREGCCTSPW
jgi:hypothetical protein